MPYTNQISPYIPVRQYPVAPDWEMTLRIAFGRGIFERTSFKNFMRQVRGWDTAVDIGAHVGSWTIAMSRSFNHVIGFEPNLVNRGYLQSNLERAQARNVIVRDEAILDEPRLKETFSMSAAGSVRNSGQSHLVAAKPGDAPLKTITLDEALKISLSSGRQVSAIKIDVEGLELAVLKSAAETIRRHRPVILVEMNSTSQRYGIAHEDIYRHMGDLGYKEGHKFRNDHVFVPVSF